MRPTTTTTQENN